MSLKGSACFLCGTSYWACDCTERWIKAFTAAWQETENAQFIRAFKQEAAESSKKGKPMVRKELLELHYKMSGLAYGLMEKKNQDYTSGAEKEDAMHNFRQFGAFGIVVRMGDKLSRLESIAKGKDMKVAESAEDTLLDLMNYSVLLMAYLKEKSSG